MSRRGCAAETAAGATLGAVVAYLGWQIVRAHPSLTIAGIVLAVLLIGTWALSVLLRIGRELDDRNADRQDEAWRSFFGGADLLGDPDHDELRRGRR